jgi:hypothetical protein
LDTRYDLLFSEKIKPYFGTSWNVQLPNLFDIKYYFDDKTRQDETRLQENITYLLGMNAEL